MKVLVLFQKRRTHRYLVNLVTQSLIKEVTELIRSQDYGKAMTLVCYKGVIVREILEEDIPAVETDLILTERCASWDLVK